VALLVGLGALLLVFAYPPFHFPILSFVVLAPAVLLLREAEALRDPRLAFKWGWWYGFVSQGLVLYWLVVALWHFTPLSGLGYLVTIVIMGVFTGGVFSLLTKLRLRAPMLPLWITLPIVWTTLEWAVGHAGDVAFPWLGIGTSLTDAPVLVQWADIAGARGIGIWLMWCSVLLVEGALSVRGRGHVRSAAWRLAAVISTVAASWAYGAHRMSTLPLRPAGVVGLVQPNIGYQEKWDANEIDREVQLLMSLSRRVRAMSRPDMIAWPEAALPGFLQERPAWDSALARFARESHTAMIIGGLYYTGVPSPDPSLYQMYNAAFYMDTTGHWGLYPVYEKRYLVPVVERTPFVPVSWFKAIPGIANWSGRFRPGTKLPLYPTPIGKVGVIVCYESAFEDLTRRYRAEGANVVFNITNDAWYGQTTAPYQHAAHLIMRAIETRMGIARAANDGVSEFVDPLGRVSDATVLGTEGVVSGRLVTSDVVPLYVRWGDWAGTGAVLATLGMLVLLVAVRRRG
jgi:apolipoprotein N-acyltransferase